MIGETGERKSAVATPDGKSRKKKKIMIIINIIILYFKFKLITHTDDLPVNEDPASNNNNNNIKTLFKHRQIRDSAAPFMGVRLR